MSEQASTSCWATWVDYALYAPIGLATMAVDDLPKAVEAARLRVTNRIVVARVIGRYAVRTAGAYVTRRLDELAAERAAEELAAEELAAEELAAELSAAEESAAVQLAAAAEPDASQQPDVEPPLADEADAVAVVPLEGADPAQGPPDAAGAAERSITVDELALADYDSLAASQIVARLDALPADELEAIRLYESTHRQRRTVIGKAHQLQSAST